MKYKSLDAFMKAQEKGEFDGVVVVDNDSVKAYDEGLNCVYDFGDEVPGSVLFDLLERLGFEVEVP